MAYESESPTPPFAVPTPESGTSRTCGNVGQTNACSVVFRGKQRVREFEITTRSSSLPATSTGEALRVKSYDLVKFIHIYFYIFLFPLAFFFSARFLSRWRLKCECVGYCAHSPLYTI